MTNADKAQPELIIHLDKPRRFQIDWNALCKLEKKIGKEEFRKIDWGNPGLNDFTNILWCGLLSEEPTLTFEHVCKFLSPAFIERWQEKVIESVASSMPDVDENAEKNEAATK